MAAVAEQIYADLESMRGMVANTDTDLFAPIRTEPGKHCFASPARCRPHSYHLGQLMQLKKTLEAQAR